MQQYDRSIYIAAEDICTQRLGSLTSDRVKFLVAYQGGRTSTVSYIYMKERGGFLGMLMCPLVIV